MRVLMGFIVVCGIYTSCFVGCVAVEEKEIAQKVIQPKSESHALHIVTAKETGGSTIGSEIRVMEISHNGELIATGSRSGEVCIWRVKTWKEVARFNAQGTKVFDLSFSPDSKFLAIASRDNTAVVWRLSDFKKVHVFRHQGGKLVRVEFGSGSKNLFTGTFYNEEDNQLATVRAWDCDSGLEVSDKKIQFSHMLCDLACSSDGRFLAISSVNEKSAVFDVKSGKKVFGLGSEETRSFGLSFSQDSSKIVITKCPPDFPFIPEEQVIGKIEIYDTKSQKKIFLKSYPGFAVRPSFNHDASLVAADIRSTDGSAQVVVWNTKTKLVQCIFETDATGDDRINSAVLHPTQGILIAATQCGKLICWSLKD